jgi:hypothetical protein
VVHGLDVVAIRVKQESRIVARMIGALSGLAVVRASRPKTFGMEPRDCRAVAGLKRKVNAARQVARHHRAAGGRDIELVNREEIVARRGPMGTPSAPATAS